MPVYTLAFSEPQLIKGGIVYAVPANTQTLIWWSLIGADLQTSMDGVNFSTIDTIAEGTVGKSITTFGNLIRASADSYVEARRG